MEQQHFSLQLVEGFGGLGSDFLQHEQFSLFPQLGRLQLHRLQQENM